MVLNIADALAAYRQGGGGAATKSALSGETGDVQSFGDMLKNFTGDAVKSLESGEKAATAAASGKADLASVVTAISNV
jgi:flagellar hook-basal body complex protein FliE